MKSFLTNCLFFGAPVLLLLLAAGFLADGYTDNYYLRFTSPRQQALIIGCSRAQRGLQPAVLNKALSHEYTQPIYNFAFTAQTSPYGEVYFNAIQKKLGTSVKHSYFILSVIPWSLAANRDELENSGKFAENRGPLATTPFVNTSPNFFYLADGYNHPYLHVLTGRLQQEFTHHYPFEYLHDDGWLEISWSADSAMVARRVPYMLGQLRFRQSTQAISRTRVSWLVKTIGFLKAHGDVYLVRMPVDPRVLGIENDFCPGFNTLLDSIAAQQQVPYFNLTGSADRYAYIDGGHLYKGSAALVSDDLAQLIIRHRHASPTGAGSSTKQQQ